MFFLFILPTYILPTALASFLAHSKTDMEVCKCVTDTTYASSDFPSPSSRGSLALSGKSLKPKGNREGADKFRKLNDGERDIFGASSESTYWLTG